VRLAVWSPLPPSPSGIADYAAEQLGGLRRSFDVLTVAQEPRVRPDADLDLYQIGNSPAHAFVYRAALSKPGVVLLHDWSVHHLVLAETVERGDVTAYLREMRRAHGEAGTYVARQVARGLGGDLLPALYPLNDRLLEGSLAIVALTEYVASRSRLRLAGRPVLHLPHHLSLPSPLPSRAEARRQLGLPEDAFVVTAPGLATVSKGLEAAIRALGRLRATRPSACLVVAGAADPRLPLEMWLRRSGLAGASRITGRVDLPLFVAHLAAADLVLALRFPSHGEISGALVRTLGVGRPALVTAGTPAAEEFPEGVVVPVDPGPLEEDELTALLDRLADDADLREALGRNARAYVTVRHGLDATVDQLAAFLGEVATRRDSLAASLTPRRAPEGSLLAYLLDEVRWAALDLGLSGVPIGHEELLEGLVVGRA
jgi:glycosyltransferase involved in cell wall biosynthesis